MRAIKHDIAEVVAIDENHIPNNPVDRSYAVAQLLTNDTVIYPIGLNGVSSISFVVVLRLIA